MQLNPQAKIPLEDIKEILELKTGFTPDELVQKWKEAGVNVWELKSKYGSTQGNLLKALKVADEHGLLEGSWQHPKLEDFFKTKLKKIAETKQQAKILQEQQQKKEQKRSEVKQRLQELKTQNIQRSMRLSKTLKRRSELVKALDQSPSTLSKPQSPPRPSKVDLVV